MKTAVSAIIIKEKIILLIKRGKNQKMEPNKWFIPGGRGEDGETPEQTIKRECKEELDIDFVPTKLFQNIEDYGYNVYKFLGAFSGKISLQEEEVEGYAWFTYEEAILLDLAFDLREVLEKLHEEDII